MGENFGFGVFIGIGVGILFTILIQSKTPSALDVYQGKTTLEYKVVDGEIVDSCVIWKSK